MQDAIQGFLKKGLTQAGPEMFSAAQLKHTM
jgi:hypothetical protein